MVGSSRPTLSSRWPSHWVQPLRCESSVTQVVICTWCFVVLERVWGLVQPLMVSSISCGIVSLYNTLLCPLSFSFCSLTSPSLECLKCLPRRMWRLERQMSSWPESESRVCTGNSRVPTYVHVQGSPSLDIQPRCQLPILLVRSSSIATMLC